MKKEWPWLKDADSIALQSAVRSLADAFDRFFRKQNDPPRFKSKRSPVQSYTMKFTNGNIAVACDPLKRSATGRRGFRYGMARFAAICPRRTTGGAARTKAVVEENGVLNLNRLYKAEQGLCVEACAEIFVAEDTESLLTVGFSDRLRLWVNEEEVYQGSWKWNPPANDGRIRPDHAHIPVQWKAGFNTIRAEVAHTEFFGWGLAVRTGLPGSLKEDFSL
ncbi:hypothetical protein [Paenibacillus oleatilyticus]|uniref:hypothetical protein n=1 Tax=Paenibacillus oleatilyticus TaxID=2594886 RepID=UPI003F684037